MLYRGILFVQISNSQHYIDLIFTVLNKLICSYNEERIAKIERLHLNIGIWINCLTYDSKNSEIGKYFVTPPHTLILDIFAHCVDGPYSMRSQPMEMICGDEARFLDAGPRLQTLMDRKCMAARFLSLIIDVLYRSTAKLQDQPLYLSLQLHFIPYLRTNSLYKRLGVALILNCWARAFRRALNAGITQVSMTVIIEIHILRSIHCHWCKFSKQS